MATGWIKSLQCKSRAYEDVHHHRPLHLISTSGCKSTAKTLKDVVQSTQTGKPKTTKPRPPLPPKATGIPPPARARNPFFPTLTELPEGHSSRNVVEIIFHTSWSQKALPGRIEMIFKVNNLPKTVARFEEYREAVKARAGAGAGNPGSRREEDARCLADGNEVMRFHCVGPTDAEVYDAGGLCTFSGKGGSIRTFPGSGGAHESAGGGKGRRAMLVCRVVAGRVCKRVDSLLENSVCRSAFDSVSGENGALVVFDSRALLPCFLIIYRV